MFVLLSPPPNALMLVDFSRLNLGIFSGRLDRPCEMGATLQCYCTRDNERAHTAAHVSIGKKSTVLILQHHSIVVRTLPNSARREPSSAPQTSTYSGLRIMGLVAD